MNTLRFLGTGSSLFLTRNFCQDLTMNVHRYHTEHDPLLKHFMSIANPGGAEPVPDAPLIYFAHGDAYLPPITSAAPNVSPSTSHVGFNGNATLPFEPGKTYRLRVSRSLLTWRWAISVTTDTRALPRLSTRPLSPLCTSGLTVTKCASLRSTESDFHQLFRRPQC
jgi:hypothetical protein